MTNPSTNAGSTQTVTADSNLQLVGTVTKGTNNIAYHTWTKTSGPDCIIVAPSEWITLIKGVNGANLNTGSYVFTLTAMDDYNYSGSSTVTITVTTSTGATPPIPIPDNSYGEVPREYTSQAPYSSF